MDLLADVVSEGRSNLDSDAFAAGATAEQVGEPCAYGDHRNHAQGNFAFLPVSDSEDHVHAAFRTFAELLVSKNDGDADERKSRNPVDRMRVAQGRNS